MNNNIYGIDFGTCNFKVFSKASGKFFTEKNTIALINKNQMYAYGDEAYAMYEKAPESINVVFPLASGVIADYNFLQTMIFEFIEKRMKGKTKNAEFLVAVPTDITEVEKRAFFELTKDPKVHSKKVYVINKPVADAIGAGVDVNNAKGIMVVNIGADTTEISVLSLGGIVLSKAVKFGGNKLDSQIISAVRKKYNLVIGSKTAEYIKCQLGSAIKQEETTVNVYGRHVVTGLPTNCTISSDIVYECLKDFINQIVDSIKSILERTPPELSADIIDTGIYLTGGSSAINRLGELINGETELHVNIADNPSECVVKGIKTIIDDEKYNEIAYIPKDRIID